MRTSNQLPEECREEIRAELDAEIRISRSDIAINPYMDGRIKALTWVLGDDGK